MSEHPESVTAVLTDNEPPNGTKLILHEGWDSWRVIVRLTGATSANGQEDWHDGATDEDPRSLHDWLKYADAVYALGEQLAVFRR